MKISEKIRVVMVLSLVGLVMLGGASVSALDMPIWNPTGEHTVIPVNEETGRPRFMVQKMGLESAKIILATTEDDGVVPVELGLVSFTREDVYKETSLMEHTDEIVAWANRVTELGVEDWNLIHQEGAAKWYEITVFDTPKWTATGGWSGYVKLSDGNFWNFEIEFRQCQADYWAQEVTVDIEALKALWMDQGMDERELEWRLNDPMFLEMAKYEIPREVAFCEATYDKMGRVTYQLTRDFNEWDSERWAAENNGGEGNIEGGEASIGRDEQGGKTTDGENDQNNGGGGYEKEVNNNGSGDEGGWGELSGRDWAEAVKFAGVTLTSYTGNEVEILRRSENGVLRGEGEQNIGEVLTEGDEANEGDDELSDLDGKDYSGVEVPELDGSEVEKGKIQWWMVPVLMLLGLGVVVWWIFPIVGRRKEDEENGE